MYGWAARKQNPEKSPSRTCFPELFIELDQPEDLRERSPALEADLGDTLERKKVVQCPADPEISFNGRVGGIAAVGSLFEVRSALGRPQVWQNCPFKCHDTIRLRTGCAHAGAAGSRRLISDFTVAGSFSEMAVAGISFAPFGPKALTA